MSKQPRALELARNLDLGVEAGLFMKHGTFDEAASLLRSQHALIGELVEAIEQLVGPSDDPASGWRGVSGTYDLFACEHCRAEHSDCTQIKHGPVCPITRARTALSKAKEQQ